MAWLERYRTGIMVFLLLLILVGLGVLLSRRIGAKGPIEIILASPTPPPPVVVHVSGAVRQSGVYILPPRSRIADALASAGGPAEGADLSRVNLAARVSDGQQVYIPAVGEAAAAPAPPAASPGAQRPININTASARELEEGLFGIGPAYAKAIVDYRERNGPFRSIEEVLNIRGIGPATLERIRSQVTVE